MGQRLGQTAIEYLATYGWMIAAAAIVASTVYTQVSPTGCDPDTRDISNRNFRVVNVGVDSNSTLTISAEDMSERNVQIRKIKIQEDGEERVIYNNNSKKLDAMRNTEIDIAQANRSNECRDFNVTINYDKGNLKNLQLKGRMTAPVKDIKEIIHILLTRGGEIILFETESSIMPTNNNICFGEDCATTKGPEYNKKSEKYINRSGDEMTGSVFASMVKPDCIGSSCTYTEGNLKGYVRRKNSTLDGTLNVTEIKPMDKLCLGDSC